MNLLFRMNLGDLVLHDIFNMLNLLNNEYSIYFLYKFKIPLQKKKQYLR